MEYPTTIYYTEADKALMWDRRELSIAGIFPSR